MKDDCVEDEVPSAEVGPSGVEDEVRSTEVGLSASFKILAEAEFR